MADEKEVYPDEEQGIEPEPTSEETDLKMETGEAEEDVYSEEGRENLEEDDEISPREAGFMEGAEEKGEMAKCAHCGKVLGDEEAEVIEKEIDGEKVWFCSDKCAQAGKAHPEKE